MRKVMRRYILATARPICRPGFVMPKINLPEKVSLLAKLRADMVRLEQDVMDQLKGAATAIGYKLVPLNGHASPLLAAAAAAAPAVPAVRRGRPPGSGKTRKRRARAVVNDMTRADVKRLVKEGKTGVEIGTALGISPATVQNIKKQLGLTEPRA